MQNNLMQEFVIQLLKENIPAAYTFHNYEHTLFVREKAVALARHMGLPAHDIELISVAALWHDTGYISTYKGHEEESCRLAKKHLPAYSFTIADIDSICEMIMGTKVPQNPRSLSAQILADADLAYLGTPDAAAMAENLFEELHALNTGLTRKAWNEQQVNFLNSHKYFTKYYRDNKEPVKQHYLADLRKAS
jgi:putative nucleotidyltransferase with HDIG domain